MVMHLTVAQRVRKVINRHWHLSNQEALPDATELELANSDAGLLRDIEREFEIELSPQSVDEVKSVGHLVQLVESMMLS